MPKVTPRNTEDKINRIVTAWEQLAPTKSFGAMTLTEFKAIAGESTAAREKIEALQDQLSQAINQRDTADETSLAKIQLVVNGVLADPTEGADGSLYEAMGYTRRSERKTGLTRKKPGGPRAVPHT